MALDDTIGLLARAPIVGLFERDALRLLAFSAESRRLRAGEMLFRRGERSDGGYVVAGGRIAVQAREGETDVILEPGSLIGRTALFVRMTRPAHATALEPSEVLRISPTLMRRVLNEFPAAATEMHAAMAADLLDFSADLEKVRQMILGLDAG